MSEINTSDKFSAYHIPNAGKRFEGHFGLEEKLIDLAMKMSEIIEEGFNFLRVEASEVLVFIATDSDRFAKPGIPPHIPITYGLRGSAMSMQPM